MSTAYIVLNLFYGIVWLALFLYRHDLRKKMLLMSTIVGFLGLIMEAFYRRDYWQPELFSGWPIGLEDFLWSFFVGGIAGVVYEELFGKKYMKRHLQQHVGSMIMFTVLGLALVIIGNIFFGFNSVYVSSVGFILFGIIILFMRHDLAMDAFASGIIFALIMTVIYLFYLPLFPGIIEKWWLEENLSGNMILGFPTEELLWGFSWGIIAGPTYEFAMGLKFKKR